MVFGFCGLDADMILLWCRLALARIWVEVGGVGMEGKG